MGFFPNIFKKPSIAKVVGAVATGGLSLVAPKLTAPITTAITTPLSKVLFPTSLSGALNVGMAVATKNPALLLSQPTQGVQPMALNVGGILQSVGGIFGGAQNPYFQGISNVANLASQFFPQSSQFPVANSGLVATPTMAAAPMIARGIATVGRSFFNRFPALATAIQGYRNMGKNVTRAKLYSMMKRFGPDFLITGGILSAAAVSELMVAGPGHRRMNPGNASALRRSLRRLESFHKLCMRADKFRGRGRSRKGCKTTGSTQFVRQG